MDTVLVISKRELTRLRSRFSGKTRIALLAIILLAIGVGYLVYQQNIGVSRAIYNMGVSIGAPKINDERFKTVQVDPIIAAEKLHNGKLDLYINGNSVSYNQHSERSLCALDAVKEYLEKHELLRISEEYPVNEAFPLRIEIRHVFTDKDLSADDSSPSFEDILDDQPQSSDDQSDYTVLEQLEEFRNSGILPEFEAEFVSDKEIIVPSLSRPPIPMAQVILAFIYVMPLFLVGVFFTSSFMEEKINRKLIVLLSAPITPLQIITGKMMPYIIYSIATIMIITIILGGNILLSLAIFIPVSLFIFGALLMVALLYRTFKDQTFFSVLAAWVVIAYLVTPAMFTGLSDISYFSPMTLAIEMYRGEQIGVSNYFLATLPLVLLFSVISFVGIRIFNEEYLMGFRSLHRKVGEAIYLVIDRSHLSLSVMFVSLIMIPVVLMIQFASLTAALNLPQTAWIIIVLPIAILSEEIAKSSSIAVLLQNRVIDSTSAIIKYSFFSAFGFFIGEKMLLYLSLSVVSETMFIDAIYSAGYLPIVLALHFTATCIIGLITARFGIKFYPIALLIGTLIHVGYNLAVTGGIIF